jgi:hypothetical protein
VLLLATGASAQTAALAEDLFRDGKKLLAQKRYDEACPKFAESARIEPSSGVELALGLCYEAQGKTASAWGAFSEVVVLARRDTRHDREQAAVKHLAALEARVSHATFVVPKEMAALDGFELRQDGVVLARAAWGHDPVDPGEHDVEARAPGYASYTTSFKVDVDGSTSTVSIPALVPLPAVAAAPPPHPLPSTVPSTAPSPSDQASQWRMAGWVTGGVGVASIVAGAVLGGVALTKVNDVHSKCPGGRCTSQSDVSEDSTAGALADASTGTFIAGGVLAAAGVAMLVFLPPPRKEERAPGSATWRPVLAPGYAGMAGAF